MKIFVLGKTSFTSKKTGKPCYVLAIGYRDEFWTGFRCIDKFVSAAVYDAAAVNTEYTAFFDMKGNLSQLAK